MRPAPALNFARSFGRSSAPAVRSRTSAVSSGSRANGCSRSPRASDRVAGRTRGREDPWPGGPVAGRTRGREDPWPGGPVAGRTRGRESPWPGARHQRTRGRERARGRRAGGRGPVAGGRGPVAGGAIARSDCRGPRMHEWVDVGGRGWTSVCRRRALCAVLVLARPSRVGIKIRSDVHHVHPLGGIGLHGTIIAGWTSPRQVHLRPLDVHHRRGRRFRAIVVRVATVAVPC